MKKLYFTAVLCCILPFICANAQEEDLLSADADFLGEEALDIPQTSTSRETLADFLIRKIPLAAARNINKAEKVHCYTVDEAANGYDGYLIDGLAVRGACGELSAEGRKLIKDNLFQSSIIYSDSVANCNITPRIMLRYIYGLDHTDVLLSYPCPSLTVFHDRSIVILNAAPGSVVIEQIINAYSKLEEKFYSPALLGQMVANGQPQNQAQKEIIRLNAPTDTPRKKWGTGTQTDTQPQQPKKSGWNKLK